MMFGVHKSNYMNRNEHQVFRMKSDRMKERFI